MIALALVIVAIVLGIVGDVAKGLLYLLIIGVVMFLGALVLGALRMRRRPGPGRHGRDEIPAGDTCRQLRVGRVRAAGLAGHHG
jgi:hypothetical protein